MKKPGQDNAALGSGDPRNAALGCGEPTNAALGCGGPGSGYTEDAPEENPAIALPTEMGWETVNAYHEFDHGLST